MQLTMLKCKIHRATVTECDLNYEGSVGIDRALMDTAGLLPFEQIDVLNINNGARFTTYVIEETAGSGNVVINGAAARLVQPGDLVIICAFVQMEEEEARTHTPRLVLLEEGNTVKQ